MSGTRRHSAPTKISGQDSQFAEQKDGGESPKTPAAEIRQPAKSAWSTVINHFALGKVKKGTAKASSGSSGVQAKAEETKEESGNGLFICESEDREATISPSHSVNSELSSSSVGRTIEVYDGNVVCAGNSNIANALDLACTDAAAPIELVDDSVPSMSKSLSMQDLPVSRNFFSKPSVKGQDSGKESVESIREERKLQGCSETPTIPGMDVNKLKKKTSSKSVVKVIQAQKSARFIVKTSLPKSITGEDFEYIYKGPFIVQTCRNLNEVEFYAHAHSWTSNEEYAIPHGRGVIYSAGQKVPVYEGNFARGKRHGEGRGMLVFDRPSSVYTGQWSEGQRHGQGTLVTPTHSYTGGWSHSSREGHGVAEYRKDGATDKYEGQWKKNMQHGTGTYTFSSGTTYSGDWEEGSRSGHGTCVYANGDEYVGEFKSGWRHGQGMIFYADCQGVYKGSWHNDSRHGQGVLYGATGTVVYEGEWRDGSRTGRGASSNSFYTYEGMWRAGQRHGPGTCTYANGDTYCGWFKNNQRSGKGKMTYAEPSTSFVEEYKGSWEADMWNGQGEITFRTNMGSMLGIFEMGRLSENEVAVVSHNGKKSASDRFIICTSANGAHVETWQHFRLLPECSRMAKLVERMIEARGNAVLGSAMRCQLPTYSSQPSWLQVERFEGLLVETKRRLPNGANEGEKEICEYVPDALCTIKCQGFSYMGGVNRGIFSNYGILHTPGYMRCEGMFKKGIFENGTLKVFLHHGNSLTYTGSLENFTYEGKGTVSWVLNEMPTQAAARTTALWEKGEVKPGEEVEVELGDGSKYIGSFKISGRRFEYVRCCGRLDWKSAHELDDNDPVSAQIDINISLDDDLSWNNPIQVERAIIHYKNGFSYSGRSLLIPCKAGSRLMKIVPDGDGALREKFARSESIVRGTWKQGQLQSNHVTIQDFELASVYKGPVDENRRPMRVGVCVYGTSKIEKVDNYRSTADEYYVGGWLGGKKHGKGFYRSSGQLLAAQCTTCVYGVPTGIQIHITSGIGIFLREILSNGAIVLNQKVTSYRELLKLVDSWGFINHVPEAILEQISSNYREFGLDGQ